MNKRHRHIEGTFSQFFRHPMNIFGSSNTPLRGNLQIFPFNYQQKIRDIIQLRFDSEIEYYRLNGLKLTPAEFDDFILKLIFDSIKVKL